MSLATTLDGWTMISLSELTPEERYDLFKRLASRPEIQAANLRDRIVKNVEVESRWNRLIEDVEIKMRSLDKVVKIYPHSDSGRLTLLVDEIDLRGVYRKALFDKKQRLIADRDREMSQ